MPNQYRRTICAYALPLWSAPVAGALVDRARKLASHRKPHPVPVLALQGAVSPLGIGCGRFAGAHVRFWRSLAQEAVGCSRRIGSVQKGTAVRAVARQWVRVVSLRSTPRAHCGVTFQRTAPKRYRKREICTSGSARGRDGNIPTYSAVDVGLPDRALPVIEVRHHRIVTDRADAAGNIVKLIAHAPHVHEHDHRWERPILLGMRDERWHPPGLGRDLNDAVLHRSAPGATALDVGIGRAAARRPLSSAPRTQDYAHIARRTSGFRGSGGGMFCWHP